jgi:hypothetical protein
MSRSYKKTPIIGYTTCRSEKYDKFIWHKKCRLHERINLEKLIKEDLEEHCSIQNFQVSNVWLMGKDGKHYFSYLEQKAHAELISSRKSLPERHSFKKRLVHQWMGK